MSTRPDPNWTRWVFASVAEHFSSNVFTPNNIPFILEGIDERDDQFMTEQDRAEVRINGPWSSELSSNWWRIWVDINILVTSYFGGTDKDAYTLERNVGLIHEYADTTISVRKHGPGPGDDGSLLGCLRPRAGKNDSIRVIHFGQFSKTDRIKQSQVDGRYVMDLCTKLMS